MGESAEEQEAQIALMDAGAALAETFEVLLNEFRLRPRRLYARMTPADALGGERRFAPLFSAIFTFLGKKVVYPSPLDNLGASSTNFQSQ